MDPLTNTAVSSVRVDASLADYRELARWARQFPQRRWAVENAKGLGCHLAQWLVASEVVFDVATAAASRQPPRPTIRPRISSDYTRSLSGLLEAAALGILCPILGLFIQVVEYASIIKASGNDRVARLRVIAYQDR